MPLAADHRAAPATHAGEATAGAQERTSEPKIGVAEFLSIAERFGFSDGAMARLRSAVSNADLADGGPHLGRYYGTAEPSMGDRLVNPLGKFLEAVHQVSRAYAGVHGDGVSGVARRSLVQGGLEPGRPSR